MNKDALQEAIRVAGSQSALARAIGVKQAHVWYWLNKAQVPAEHCGPIEAATGVKRQALRPDLFGEAAA